MKEEDSEALKSINRNIRLYIASRLGKKGWTLARLSEECGVNYLTLCNMAKGKHSPNLRTIVKVFSVLGLRLEVTDNELGQD